MWGQAEISSLKALKMLNIHSLIWNVLTFSILLDSGQLPRGKPLAGTRSRRINAWNIPEFLKSSSWSAVKNKGFPSVYGGQPSWKQRLSTIFIIVWSPWLLGIFYNVWSKPHGGSFACHPSLVLRRWTPWLPVPAGAGTQASVHRLAPGKARPEETPQMIKLSEHVGKPCPRKSE